MAAADLPRRRPRRLLLQDRQDLLLAEPALAHLVLLRAVSPEDSHNTWISFRGAGQAPSASPPPTASRWRAEQAIEELLHGTDLDHLVGYRLHPNRVVVGFRLLARNLAIGLQVADAGRRPAAIREPRAFRAAHVDGLGTFMLARRTILVASGHLRGDRWRLPWSRLTVRRAA